MAQIIPFYGTGTGILKNGSGSTKLFCYSSIRLTVSCIYTFNATENTQKHWNCQISSRVGTDKSSRITGSVLEPDPLFFGWSRSRIKTGGCGSSSCSLDQTIFLLTTYRCTVGIVSWSRSSNQHLNKLELGKNGAFLQQWLRLGTSPKCRAPPAPQQVNCKTESAITYLL